MRTFILAIALAAPHAAHAGEAERLAERLASMINNSSGHVQCAPAPDAPTVICSARGDDAERLAAYLVLHRSDVADVVDLAKARVFDHLEGIVTHYM